MKNKMDSILITELFLAMAGDDYSRCFYGTIKRGYDEKRDSIVYGKIKINGGFICANARDQQELGRKLDEMVLMVLGYGLHGLPAMTTLIFETDFYLN